MEVPGEVKLYFTKIYVRLISGTEKCRKRNNHRKPVKSMYLF